MKKLFLLAVTMLLAFTSFSQSGTTAYGFRPVMVVPDTSYKFPMQAKIGDLVYVVNTHQLYELAIAVGTSKNMHYILASSARYNYPSYGTFTTATINGQILSSDHVNNLKTNNSFTATDTLFGPVISATTKIYSPSVTATTTLTLPGTTTITKTSGNANSATLSHSLVVTDSMTVGKTLTGTSALRGSANFTTTATRVAVYIPGATSSDYYVIRGIAPTQFTLPIAADFMNCFAKTDSLIVMRAAGTTSGLGFTYFRIK